MNLQKIKHSRCPKCHQHGIPAFKKFGLRYCPTVKCKFCQRSFSANFAFYAVSYISVAIGIGLIGAFVNKVINIPNWVWYIVAIICCFLIEYFAPLEENDSEK